MPDLLIDNVDGVAVLALNRPEAMNAFSGSLARDLDTAVLDRGSGWLLARRVGQARAREMTLLSDRLSAKQALDWVLVNRVVAAESFLEESLTLAKRLANGPVNALARIRRLHETAAMLDFDSPLMEDDRLQSACSTGPRRNRAAKPSATNARPTSRRSPWRQRHHYYCTQGDAHARH
ncbi:enoyl-CoA hydratase-related protein [Chachezhania sediminis]|uniref:enoyl-CoA hydratase-related protein n=1 Tax=Chachezhania sediminis TaxID=2599291 RepID=UPI00131DD0C2|nr:enoyl-CoA hydratase-related protein [Chachezhania sediminis]